jgi:hypothetical protein
MAGMAFAILGPVALACANMGLLEGAPVFSTSRNDILDRGGIRMLATDFEPVAS